MQAAAKHLTPVTLELGGKSPCIVDSDINIEYTAKRIAWGKFINAGQTCIAPDYLLVDKTIKQDLLNSIKKCVQEFYGNKPATSPDYGRIINQQHFLRLVELLKGSEIIIGGEADLVNVILLLR
jgi:aldehyde dehydrogenase (NAD+)